MGITRREGGATPVRATRGRLRPAAAVVALVALLVALSAGCSGFGGDDLGVGSADESLAEPAAREAPEGALEGGSRGGHADQDRTTTGANRTTVQTRAVIRHGEISLVSKDLDAARDEVDGVVSRHGGYLSAEETSNDRDGKPERSMLVMRIPEPAFDAAMDDLGEIGRTEHADRSSEDVTTEVIDVQARVATQETSLAELRRLMRRAVDLGDMIRLESEIATRQAALESMKAQEKYLADQTALSTITVHLRTPSVEPEEDEEGGFLVGLKKGWSALTAVLVTSATVAGAILPFLALLTVVGVPLWLLVRTAARRRHPGEPLTPPAGPTPDAG